MGWNSASAVYTQREKEFVFTRIGSLADVTGRSTVSASHLKCFFPVLNPIVLSRRWQHLVTVLEKRIENFSDSMPFENTSLAAPITNGGLTSTCIIALIGLSRKCPLCK